MTVTTAIRRLAWLGVALLIAQPLASGAAGKRVATPKVDLVAGQQAAALCTMCHGNGGFPGLFYTLPLAGRDAVDLAARIKLYRSGQLYQPVMNAVTHNLSDAQIANIAAYFQSLGTQRTKH